MTENLSDSCASRNHGTLYHKTGRKAFRLGCNRWNCSRCGPRKAGRARDRLKRVPWQKFLTLTLPPGRGWPKRPNLAYQSAHLRSFWRALERRYGKFRYAWAREVGADNGCICHPTIREVDGVPTEALDCVCGKWGRRLHLHVLLDIRGFIPNLKKPDCADCEAGYCREHKWLQAVAHDCGFGFVDVRAARHNKPLVDYLVKYLTKGWSMPFPPRTRRIQTRDVDALPPAVGWAFTWYAIELCVPIQFDGLACEPGVAWWHDSG